MASHERSVKRSVLNPFNNYILYAPEALVLPLCVLALGLRRPGVQLAGLLLLVVALVFYRGSIGRRPNQVVSNQVVSPADGRVLAVVDHGHVVQIAIFLGLHNVHVQYAPVSGTITSIRRKPGEFAPAYLFEKSDKNERVETVFDFGRVSVVQIAGQLARRVVSFRDPGDFVKAGEPLGLIKFGSRVDVWAFAAPRGKVLVSPGQRVRIGQPLLDI